MSKFSNFSLELLDYSIDDDIGDDGSWEGTILCENNILFIDELNISHHEGHSDIDTIPKHIIVKINIFLNSNDFKYKIHKEDDFVLFHTNEKWEIEFEDNKKSRISI